MSYVYFVSEGTDAIKIGFTAEPAARLAELQVGNPNELSFVGSCLGSRELENAIHKYFKRQCIRGEWFQCDDKMLKFIELICSPTLKTRDAVVKRSGLKLIPKKEQSKCAEAIHMGARIKLRTGAKHKVIAPDVDWHKIVYGGCRRNYQG